MIKIGLAGGIGSGKSYVAALFEKQGIVGIDTDIISRNVCRAGTPCIKEIADFFGQDILLENGELDRKKLAGIIFDNTEKRLKLNEITHKYIIEECMDFFKKSEESGMPCMLVQVPLMYESGFDKLVDVVCAVTADTETRISRIIKRDNITEDEAMARINKQMSNEFLERRADYIIKNGKGDCVEEQVLKTANAIFEKYDLKI